MKESLLTDVFWQAGIFLVLAALIIPVLRYCKIPAALGYLLVGIAFGPYALGAATETFPLLAAISLQDSENVKVLAELGIVLLLFIIGLELTPRRLWQMRSLVFGLGGIQVVTSALFIGSIAYLWGNNTQVSILLGLSLALSSTAIVIQWLHEQKLFSSNVGRSSFSILLFQDLAVIPILFFLIILTTDTEQNILNFVAISSFKMCATVLAIYFIGKWTLKPVFLFANKHGGAEVFMALSLLVIVASAYFASLAGLSMALGAFIAGLLLADTEYRHEIAALITPFKSMLLGIFFLSFGMGINLSFIAEKPFWLFTSMIGLMSLKGIIIFFLCKLWRQTTAVATESAILLSQAGEFGLLIVGSALTAGLMEENIGQFMLITVGMTMLVTPIIAPVARRVGAHIEEKSHDEKSYHANQAQTEEKQQHIVIFGFGRVGRAIADTLCQEGFDILGFDHNVETVNTSRSKSRAVYLGNVSKRATIKAARLDKALCAVITLDDATATKEIVKTIRSMHPHIPIVVRAHNLEDQQSLEEYEDVDAITEHTLISNKLSERVLAHCRLFDNEE
jgi:monovalent cation:proton antiporter-2 (CPA2) family protein